jgi:hypothetical protein
MFKFNNIQKFIISILEGADNFEPIGRLPGFYLYAAPEGDAAAACAAVAG